MKQILKCIGWVVLNFALQFIIQIAFSIPAVAGGMTENSEINAYIMNNLLLLTLISNIVFILIMLITAKIKKQKLKAEWGIDIPPVKSVFFPAVSAFLFSLGFACVTYNTEAGNSLPIQNSADYFSDKVPFLGVLLMVVNLLVLAPIAEEMLCRGIMMNGLKKRFSPKTALVLSAVIFGAMHIMAGGPVLVIGCIIIGLIFGLTYHKTGSLTAAVIVHAAANLPDFIFMALPPFDGIIKVVITAVCFLGSAVVLEVWYGNILKGLGNEKLKENN